MPQHQLSSADAHEYIVYACPRGELADQLASYFAASRELVGPNVAHQYTPHCTLTGFFHDDPDAIGIYCAALEAALGRARPHQPPVALSILRMELQEQFHGLLLDGAWLKALIADFARSVHSPTRRDALRLKDWLHLSLAYAFPSAQHEPLAKLARELVDPQAPVLWELGFYEREVSGAWTCHSRWPL
jgi:ubiquitin-associated SH3 domain-containing protein